MRIALVVRGGLHPSGETEVVPSLLALLAHLATRHEVHAFALHHLPAPATYQLRGATVHDLGRPAARRRLKAARIWTALRAKLAEVGPFDVIHGIWAQPAGLVAALAGRTLGTPSVITCDSGEFVALPDVGYGSQLTAGHRARVAVACRLASRVTVCSEHMAALAARHGVHADVLPLGIDLERFAAAPRPPDGPPWRLLQVASLNAVKDQLTLVEGLALATHHGLDFHLDLVGEDTMHERVQRFAAELGQASRVTFHGFLPQDRLPDLFASAHLYVQSSRHEAAGVSMLEAAAAGLPTLGTRVGYVADWEAGGAAAAVEPGDAEALQRGIRELLADPARRRAIGERARARALDYDAAHTTEAFESLYAELAARRLKRRP